MQALLVSLEEIMANALWKWFDWLLGVTMYTIIIVVVLGVITLLIPSIYFLILDKLGVWSYLVFVLLGICAHKWHREYYFELVIKKREDEYNSRIEK